MDVRFFMFGQKAHFPASAMRPPAGTPLRKPAPVAPPPIVAISAGDIYARRRQESAQ